MSILSNYLKNKRKEKLYSKLFALKVDSAKFLKESETSKEAADNVRTLIRIKESDSIGGDIYLSCYLRDHNKQIQNFEENASIAYQKYLNAQEEINIIQKELDAIDN